KLLIIKTPRQFPGKAWLHYDIAFCRDAAVSGLTDWSHMNLDLYNFHTHTSTIQSGSYANVSPQPFCSSAMSSNLCHSWNDGSCCWPFGQCHYRHCCEECEGDHPDINVLFRHPGHIYFTFSPGFKLSSFPQSVRQELVPPSRVTPIDAHKLQHELCLHPNQALVDYVHVISGSGFRLGFNPESVSLKLASQNMRTEFLQPSVIDQYLCTELEKGCIAGPFSISPLPNLHINSTPPSRSKLSAFLKSTLQSAGVPGNFSGHSFPVGAATTAASRGIPDHLNKTM
ncbi:unnamed protein product, partial [Porites evermanni]